MGRCRLSALRSRLVGYGLWAISCGVFLGARCAQAQAVDSLAQVQPVDSRVQAPPDTLEPPPPLMDFGPSEAGTVVGDTLPIALPALDLPSLLATTPGSFLYDFGTPGWPDAWAPDGLPDRQVSLRWHGLPYDDPITGRPRYELVMLSFLARPQVQAGTRGAAYGLSATLRPYATARPLTEIRYRSTRGDLKAVEVAHVQQRRLRLFGREGLVNLLAGYGGAGASGEYPGSELQRQRQVLGRVRYAQPGWSLELLGVYNGYQVGAHGGVIPVAGQSIYQRVGALVEDEGATRGTTRNDLAVTYRRAFLPAPLTATAYRTGQRLRFRHADTLQARTVRYGVRLAQAVSFARQQVTATLEAWTDRVRGGNAFENPGAARQQHLHLNVRDSLRLAGFTSVVQGGVGWRRTGTVLTGSASLARQRGWLGVEAEVGYFRPEVARLDRWGFGGAAEGLAGLQAPRQHRIAGRLRLGEERVRLAVFARYYQTRDAFDVFATARADTVAVQRLGEPVRHLAAGAELSFRRAARRGVYLVAQPTVFRLLNPAATAAHQRLDGSLPAFYLTARLGLRLLLFQGDLDLDASLQGRFWTAFRSRRLHQATGLLVLPEATDERAETSGTLDLVLAGGVRGATVFVAYENLLSGVAFAGNLLVPVYPLPERRFRFGVYWPIWE